MQKEIELDSWQKEIFEYDGNIILCKGRQIGGTYIFAIKAAEYMIKHENSNIIICSLTEDQAILIIMMMIDYLEKKVPKQIDKRLHRKPTSTRICLINGSQTLARPVGNTGDAVRGFTGEVLILDEVSRFNELILTAAKPILMTTGGQIWMTSTPYGKQGYFYKSFQNKEGRFKIWHKSSEEVVYNRKISENWTKEKREQAIKHLEQEKMERMEHSR